MCDKKKENKFTVLVIAIFIPLVAGSGILGVIVNKGLNSLSYTKTEKEVQEALDKYYSHVNVNNRNIDLAYSRLSDNFKSRVSLAKYRDIFKKTRSITVKNNDIEVLLNQKKTRASVFVKLDVTTINDDHETWEGFLEFINEDGGWFIETMKGLIKKK